MLTFYDGFFLNLCVLIASLFVYEELVKKNSFEIQTISITIINGLLGGLLAAILMRFNIETSANAIIDLRIIPFMLVILYGNWLSTSITGGLIIFIRFMMGINIYSAINIIFILASWIIFCYCFKKIKNRWISIVVMLTLSNTVYTVLNAILSAGKGVNISLIATYWISCILGGLIAVYIMDYLNETKLVFKRNSKYAFTDPLTGLNNVRSFDLAFNKAKSKLEKSNESMSIMILDIDHFKQVNDTYGHLEGDLVLKKVAAILKMSQDPEDIISRNGGEEFSVLLNNCSHIEAYEKADALRKIMENSFFIIKNGTITIHVTISIGITTYKDTTIEIDQLYDHADQALYVAKKSGRNKVCSYSQVIDLVPT
jgi:diguanylate cyclase